MEVKAVRRLPDILEYVSSIGICLSSNIDDFVDFTAYKIQKWEDCEVDGDE